MEFESFLYCVQSPDSILNILNHQSCQAVGVHSIRYKKAELIWHMDGQWARLPDAHRHIAGEPPLVHRKIPDHAVTFSETRVGGHRATDREATEGTNRE